MTKAEFDNIVADAVANGADKAEAEEYAIGGYKIPVDDKGKPVFEGESRKSRKSGKSGG